MNQKVQQLLDNGQLTIADILEYAQKYMDAVDKYDDEQIDKYYQDDYFEQYNMEFYQAEHERMMYSQDMYGQEEQEMSTHIRSSNPEYVIASTSYKLEETYIFEANKDGNILDLGEYGGIAKRWEDLEWISYYTAVDKTFGEGRYEFVRWVESGNSGVMHNLFKRVELSEADFWDGDESDKALQ
jgi:hypothetical protein